jgi:hypothetical protein
MVLMTHNAAVYCCVAIGFQDSADYGAKICVQ